MPAYRTVTITEVLAERPGLTRVRVTSEAAGEERAAACVVTGKPGREAYFAQAY